MKFTTLLLILATASAATASDRFQIALQRAEIEARIEAIPGDPMIFNRPRPALPSEAPTELKRRLREEILGPYADIAPHPATEFGMRLSALRRAEEEFGFDLVADDFRETLRALRAWLETNEPR